MKSRKISELFVIGTTALILAGCASEETKSQGVTTTPKAQDPVVGIVGAPTEGRESNEPLPPPKTAQSAPPVKEAKAKETKAAEQQASGGPSLAIPTGQRSTSTLLLETLVPTEVIAGQPYTYDIRITNLTDAPVDNVVVTDTLPPEFKLASSTPKPQGVEGGVTTWVLGPMAPREVKTIHLTGTAPAEGKVTSCASATFSSALCSTVSVVLPVLRVTMDVPPEAILCDKIPAKITVANVGSGTARNVRVTSPELGGLKTSDGKAFFESTVPALAAGENKQFDFTLSAEKPGRYATSATAVADANLTASSSESTIRVSQPVLAIDVNGPERVFFGRPFTYDITVTNTGDAIAKDTVIENPIPAGATFVSGTDNAKASATAVTWTLGALPPKATRTVKATFNAPAAGDIKYTATAKASCANAATKSAATAAAGIPALLLTGFDDPDPVQVGDSTSYTVVLTNQGSAILTNVRLVCTMDEGDGMQYASSEGVTTGAVTNRTITFQPVARLEAKQNVTYKIKIKAAKEGQVNFKAEATCDQITKPPSRVETTNFYR